LLHNNFHRLLSYRQENVKGLSNTTGNYQKLLHTAPGGDPSRNSASSFKLANMRNYFTGT